MVLLFRKSGDNELVYLRGHVKNKEVHSIHVRGDNLSKLAIMALLYGFKIGSLENVRTPLKRKKDHGEVLIPLSGDEIQRFYQHYCEKQEKYEKNLKDLMYYLVHAEENEYDKDNFEID